MDLFWGDIKALDTENMIGGMVQYAPAKEWALARMIIFILRPLKLKVGVRFIVYYNRRIPCNTRQRYLTVPISLNWCNPAISSLAEVIPIGMNRQTKKVAHVFLIFPYGRYNWNCRWKLYVFGVYILGARAIITNGKGTKIEYKSV